MVWLIKDSPDQDDMISFPPEPYFIQPIAEAAAKQLRDKLFLNIVPPSHHHTHDYIVSSDNMCPIVGEAQLGSEFRVELDKCLPDMCKCLQIMEHSIGITSSESQCSIHLGSVKTRPTFADDFCHSLVINSISFQKGKTEDDIGKYILDILNTLEACIIIHLGSDRLIKTPNYGFLCPGLNMNNFHEENQK